MDTPTDFRVTPLHVAAETGHTKVAKVNPNMIPAVYTEDCSQILLEHDAKVNAANLTGDTSLHMAARGKDSETVQASYDVLSDFSTSALIGTR